MVNKDRAQRFRDRQKKAARRQINTYVPAETGAQLDALAAHWGCSKKEAIARAIAKAFKAARLASEE